MPAVQMASREQYIKAIEVLDRVGGTWQGVGFEEKFLLVTEAQCKALLEAKVITPEDVKYYIKSSNSPHMRAKP